MGNPKNPVCEFQWKETEPPPVRGRGIGINNLSTYFSGGRGLDIEMYFGICEEDSF
jgi:hypothetical protein